MYCLFLLTRRFYRGLRVVVRVPAMEQKVFEMISDINRYPIDGYFFFRPLTPSPVIKVMYLRPDFGSGFSSFESFFFASYGFMKNCQFIARTSTPSLISLCQVSCDLLPYFY